MKKQRLKNYLKLGVLLFGIFITLWSCEKETTFIGPETNNSPNQLKLSESSFSELFKTEKFKNAYLKTISKKQTLSKGTLYAKNTSESIYEFTINSSSIKQIDYKKSTSYTMFIRRKEKTETSFENLVIKIDSSQNISAYILKYTYTSEPILNTTHNSYSFDGDVEVTKIDHNKINGLQSKMQYACTDVYQVKCNGGTGGCNGSWHTPGQICYDLFSQCISLTQVGMDCGYFDDGTDGSSGSGSNNGEDGTTSGGGDGSSSDPNNNDPNQLVTIPNDCKTCPDEFLDEVVDEETPCDKIKKSIAQNAIQSEISNMSNKTSDTNEWGRYKLTSASVVQTPPSTSSGEVSFPSLVDGKYTMMAHTHNSPASDTYSIFSWVDLEALALLLKKGKIDTNNFTVFLATADETYYALTIDDTVNFLQFFALGTDANFDPEIAEKRVEQASIYYGELEKNDNPKIDYNTDPLGDEKAFLNFLQDNTLGLSLFESNSDFSIFKKVTYNKTTDNIDKTPCQ